jgi:predicted permease
MDRLVQDLRYALRRMARSPGFTTIAVISLALGIGANTAIFSLVNAVLLSGVPMRAPEEVVEVYTSEENDGYPYSLSSIPDLMDLKDRTDLFAGVAGYEAFFTRLEADDGVQPVFGEAVSWDMFSLLGVNPEAGRFFVSEEGQTEGTHPVVVLGFTYWGKMYGGDRGIVGQSLRMAGREWTVVGVAPESLQGFTSPGLAVDMFVPYMMAGTVNFEGAQTNYMGRRGNRSTFIKARLAPSISVEQAQVALETMSAQNRAAYPENWRGRSFNVLPSSEVAIHPIVDGPLLGVAALLLTVVGLVLLIACTNLAGFLLARASQRRKEIAVRLAMGARRWTLIRQLLSETVVLALLGGGAGLLVANWVLQAIMAFQPPIPIPINLDVGLDGKVLFFTLAISVAAGVFFGLVPALQSTNPDVAPTLKDETGTGSGRRKRFSLRNILIVSQVAISMVLLLGAGLFLRSLQEARDIDIGFSVREGGTAWVMRMGNEMDSQEFQTLVTQMEERALALPGIENVASADLLPLGVAFGMNDYDIPGVEPPTGMEHHEIATNTVSPTFFDLMGIPIVTGRALSPEDREGTEPVVVISETAARRYWPGESPIGKSIVTPSGEVGYRVVGVARDTKTWTLGEEYRPYVYRAMRQRAQGSAILVATGSIPEAQIAGQLRTLIRETDPRLVLMESKTMSQHLSIALFPPRMAAILLGFFGGLALILASTGLYGSVAFSVSRRSREVGIRISLGADARRVIGMVLRGALTLVAIGGAIGLFLSVGLAQLIGGFLYGIGSLDPITFIGIPMFLAVVALLAAFVPARRASRVNPVEALKAE